jgi:SAM-dependent methyltransferase
MPRYDGIADWYDQYISTDARPLTELALAMLRELLGPGQGRCLDLGCGGGVAVSTIASLGWSVVGVDESADQLRVATDRAGDIAEQFVRADAASLPFEDASFDAIASMFLHTDVDDIAPVFGEAARVLRPGGRLAYVGTHPCFVGPLIEPDGDRWIVHPGYALGGWHQTGPGLGNGVRGRVGVRQVPLAELLNALSSAGFVLERVAEVGPADPPSLLGLAAQRR